MINNFLNPYQPYNYNPNSYQQPANSNSVSNVPPTNVNWIRVADIESTRNQVVQPNSQLWMMNTNEPIFYVKSADALGVSTLKAYRFEEITSPDKTSFKEEIDLSAYVKKEDVEKMVRDILKENSLVKVGKANGKSIIESNEQ